MDKTHNRRPLWVPLPCISPPPPRHRHRPPEPFRGASERPALKWLLFPVQIVSCLLCLILSLLESPASLSLLSHFKIVLIPIRGPHIELVFQKEKQAARGSRAAQLRRHMARRCLTSRGPGGKRGDHVKEVFHNHGCLVSLTLCS